MANSLTVFKSEAFSSPSKKFHKYLIVKTLRYYSKNKQKSFKEKKLGTNLNFLVKSLQNKSL